MKIFAIVLIAILPINSAFAVLYHGIFTGTVENFNDGGFTAPPGIGNGSPFTLRFEIDSDSDSISPGFPPVAPLFVGLDIAGFTGTFGNNFVEIFDNESGVQDRFSMSSFLDSPLGIFDGQSESNVSLNFIGGPTVFTGTGLAQPFTDAFFTSLSGSFDVGGVAYFGDLNVTSGFYIPGALPPSVPVPATAWLFGSGLFALAAAARALRGRSGSAPQRRLPRRGGSPCRETGNGSSGR